MRTTHCLGFVFVVISASVFGADLANARLSKESDLSAIVEVDTSTYDVKRDGTYTAEYDSRIAVLSEAGRDAQAVKRVGFNARAAKFELISAATINDGVEIKVAPSNIEIKEIGDAKVFDSMKEAIISFPSVRVGSKIALRYRLKFNEVPLEGFFSAGIILDLRNVDMYRQSIRSELPLFVSIHDKMGLFDVKQRKEGSRYIVEISNKEKIRLEVVQEDGVFVDNGRLPSVLVSTQESWKNFGKSVVDIQEKYLAIANPKQLPQSLEAIRAAAQNEPIERRMAFVAGRVAQEFRYFGDWRRRKGGHEPRSLEEFAETAYGDCKDMSMAVVAIARAMGLKADLAWLWRGDVFLDDNYYRLPNEFSFNHAVARVEDGGVQWIDATNPVAIPGKVFADIAQRPALVFAKDGVYFDRTPDLSSKDSFTRVDLVLHPKAGGSVDWRGKLTQKGRAVTHAEWALLFVPSEQFQYEVARWLARNERLVNYDVKLPATSSRVARELTIPASFTIADLGLRTTAGIGFPLMRSETIDILLYDIQDRFSDVWLGAPGIVEEEYTFPKASLVGNVKLGCDLASKWIKLSRSVKSGARGVEVKSRYEVLQPIIPNADFRSTEYRVFQNRVRYCFNRSAIILSSTASP